MQLRQPLPGTQEGLLGDVFAGCDVAVIASAMAVTVFWQAPTMRPYACWQPAAALGSSRCNISSSVLAFIGAIHVLLPA
ncbi:hypothetical protein FHR53_002479 [Xanthomonas arboricola]